MDQLPRSQAAGLLKEQKLIEYSRGAIRILDVTGREKRACECYHIIKEHLDNYQSLIAELRLSGTDERTAVRYLS